MAQGPPIPSSPVVGNDGRITPEWWRWLYGLFATVAAAPGSIAQVVTVDSPLPDLGQLALSPLSLAAPADATPDPVQLALMALALMRPADPPPNDPASGAVLIPPPDTIDGDQLALRAQMIRVP